MPRSTKLSDSVHILALIALDPLSSLTSARIAKSLNSNPSAVRQIMSELKKGGLILSVPGHPKPQLAHDPAQITLLQIAEAIGQTKFLFVDTKIDPLCGPGQNIQMSVKKAYDKIENEISNQLSLVTLNDILIDYKNRLTKYPELAKSDD